MAAAYQFTLVDTLPKSFITRMLSNDTQNYIYQTLAQVWIWALSDNQNGRHLPVCICGHSNFLHACKY